MNALDELAKLVLNAEINARSEELRGRLETAGSELRDAEERHRIALQHLSEVRERRGPQLEEARASEQRLRELSLKAARLQSYLDRQQVETLLVKAKQESAALLAEATQELNAAQAEERESLEKLKAATSAYQAVRAEFDRLLPAVDADRDGDDVLRRAEELFPAGRLRALEREISHATTRFGSIPQNEQYYQMMVWIGRVRRLQQEELNEDEQRRCRFLFGELVGLSRAHQPGYIEAFRQEFTTDWDQYIADADRCLKQLVEVRQRSEAQRRSQEEEQQRRDEERDLARKEAAATIQKLRAVMLEHNLPEQGAEEFCEALRGLKGVATSDPELLDLIFPYRDLLTEGSEFRALRRNLQKMAEEQEERERTGPDIGDLDELLSFTAGKRAVMIGGARREDVRRQLEQLFQFKRLEWEDYERTQSAKLDSLQQSVKAGGVDLVLILKSFVHHHVSEQLRPVCQRNGVPCLMVDHGYGAAQIAETIRTALPAMNRAATPV